MLPSGVHRELGGGEQVEAAIGVSSSAAGFAGLLPASYLSALMEQMALQGPATGTSSTLRLSMQQVR
jgi:mevalonate pyrophosphate decarboxylase